MMRVMASFTDRYSLVWPPLSVFERIVAVVLQFRHVHAVAGRYEFDDVFHGHAVALLVGDVLLLPEVDLDRLHQLIDFDAQKDQALLVGEVLADEFRRHDVRAPDVQVEVVDGDDKQLLPK